MNFEILAYVLLIVLIVLTIVFFVAVLQMQKKATAQKEAFAEVEDLDDLGQVKFSCGILANPAVLVVID